MSGPVYDAVRGVAGHQVISTAGAAIALTVPSQNGIPASAALLMSVTANSYWRADGTTATVANGFPLPTNRDFFYVGKLSDLSIIGDAGAELRVVYFW